MYKNHLSHFILQRRNIQGIWIKCVNVEGDHVEILMCLFFLELSAFNLGHEFINHAMYMFE